MIQSKRLLFVIIVFFVFIGACIYFSLFPRLLMSNSFGFGSSKMLNGILGYLFLVFGAIFGSAFRLLVDLRKKGRKTIKLWTLIKSTMKSIDLWVGISLSPIIYPIILKQANIDLSAFIILAFENGFFCSVIAETFINLNKIEQK